LRCRLGFRVVRKSSEVGPSHPSACTAAVVDGQHRVMTLVSTRCSENEPYSSYECTVRTKTLYVVEVTMKLTMGDLKLKELADLGVSVCCDECSRLFNSGRHRIYGLHLVTNVVRHKAAAYVVTFTCPRGHASESRLMIAGNTPHSTKARIDRARKLWSEE
jgi:hypothetical protein